jgi:hypothetical protein
LVDWLLALLVVLVQLVVLVVPELRRLLQPQRRHQLP